MTTNTDNTVYFVPATCSQSSQNKKRPRKKKPAIVIPQTPPVPSSSSSSGTESTHFSEEEVVKKPMKKVRFKSLTSSDSDTNLPLIRLSQANIVRFDSDGSDEGPPLIRTSGTSCSESDAKNRNSSDISSVDIPNAQPMKYLADQPSSEDDMDNEGTQSSTTDQRPTPSPIPKSFKQKRIDEYLATAPTPADFLVPNQPDDPGETSAPVTSTPKESLGGAYSLVSNEPRLSTL